MRIVRRKINPGNYLYFYFLVLNLPGFKMNKKKSALSKLLVESLMATVLVFFVFWVLFLTINISFKPFNFVAKAIKEVNLSDFYFSGLQSPVVDTNIVLVNIEDLGRKDIAALVDKIYKVNPAVIGLDVFFFG